MPIPFAVYKDGVLSVYYGEEFAYEKRFDSCAEAKAYCENKSIRFIEGDCEWK